MIYIKVVDKNGKEFISGYSEYEQLLFECGDRVHEAKDGDNVTITAENTQILDIRKPTLWSKVKDLYSNWKEKRGTKT